MDRRSLPGGLVSAGEDQEHAGAPIGGPVPGAQPQSVEPGDATPLEDAPVVVGDEGVTLTRP